MANEYHHLRLPFGAELAVTLNHEDASLTLRLVNKHETRAARLTLCGTGQWLSVGGALTCEATDEEPLKLGLFAGLFSAHLGFRGLYGQRDEQDRTRFIHPPGLLRRVVQAIAGDYRRRLSVELSYSDYEDVEGRELRLRVCLWDDDAQSRPRNPLQWSVSLTRLLFGEPVQSADEVVEERDVVVALPEATYPMRARIMQRVIMWPRWPLRRHYRWVTFSPACMLVPRRKSDGLAYEGSRPGCTAAVSGQSFAAGIGELVRSVLRDREAYGGRKWAPKPTEHRRESHRVALVWAKPRPPGVDSVAFGADLFHDHPLWLTVTDTGVADIPEPALPHVMLSRRASDGGVFLLASARASTVLVDGVPLAGPGTMLWPGSTLQLGPHSFTVHFDPIGPAAPAVQLELVPTPQDDIASDVAEVTATLDTRPPAPSELEVPSRTPTDDLFAEQDPEDGPAYVTVGPGQAGETTAYATIGPEPAPPPARRWEGD